MRISLVTPTANRPAAFAMAESNVVRQTRQPDEWIVADGGTDYLRPRYQQRHVRDPRPPGTENFLNNVLNGVLAATGDILVFWEDDDWYGPTHLEGLERLMAAHPLALAAGDDQQCYYNLPQRCFRVFDNVGASLCQTAIRKDAVPIFIEQVEACRQKRTYGLDTTFWRRIAPSQWAIERTRSVIGLKGLPGQVGLGIGHRPGNGWTPDPEGQQLRAWIGADAEIYEQLIRTGV